MMTREQAMQRYEELETKSFFLAMKDNWTRADFDEDDKMFREMLMLKETYKL